MRLKRQRTIWTAGGRIEAHRSRAILCRHVASRFRARLKHEDFVPSDAIRKLDRIVGYLESRRNPAMRLLDVVTFWSAHCVFLAERWQQEFGPHIRGWLDGGGRV